MPAPIEFWFDFTSPYGYVASELVDALAARHGRTVRWRPILLGPIFKVVGTGPLTQIPLKGEYSRHDFARTARYHQVAFRLPEKFPVGSQVAARAFYFIDDSDPALAAGFARRVFRAYFAEGRDISDPAVVMEAAAQSGADIPALTQGLAGEAIKDRLKAEVENAMKAGIFGSPWFVVDGEPFWGVDRLPMLEEWISRGGW